MSVRTEKIYIGPYVSCTPSPVDSIRCSKDITHNLVSAAPKYCQECGSKTKKVLRDWTAFAPSWTRAIFRRTSSFRERDAL